MDKIENASEGDADRAGGTVTRDEACRMFGVSSCTWRRWERNGWVRGTWAGNYKLYHAGELSRLLAACGRLAPPYPDPDRPGVYRVPLSSLGMRRREAIIDAQSLPLIEGKVCCWAAGPSGAGQVTVTSGDTSAALRRLIVGVTEAALHVMHRNGDALDCRRENLVVRTMVQQLASLPKLAARNGRPCSSRFKGVGWEKQTRKWRAQIVVAGKTRNLGRFEDEIAAAVAYDEAARELFGEHAWLNFPDGVDAWLEKEGFTQRERAA